MTSGNFFDFKEQVTRRRPLPAAIGDGAAPAGAPGDPPLSVSQLTARITKAIKSGMPQSVMVKGEVSNFHPNRASGHVYFTMKDAGACVDCVMFKSDADRVKFTPGDGMELIAGGRVDVFPKKGKYQLYVASLQPVGQGALELAFQQLKAKLEGEGLFAAERSRPLPAYPVRIAIVTSCNTAALQDVLKVLRRFPWLRLFVYNVPVQGDGAGRRIADAIKTVSRGKWRAAPTPPPTDPHIAPDAPPPTPPPPTPPFDVLLLVRGGGSLEDLWCFNEEAVARAIAASDLPVITGIGHEIDTSIADLVADYWAHTPTEAAQVLTRNWHPAKEAIDFAGIRLERSIRNGLRDARVRLTGVERHEFFRRPLDRVNALRQLLDEPPAGMGMAVERRTSDLREHLHDLAARLERHGPAAIVARLRQRLHGDEHRLSASRAACVLRCKDRLADLTARLSGRHPRHRLRLLAEPLDATEARLRHAMAHTVQNQVEHLDGLARYLSALSPEGVLRRGYSITRRKKDGAIVRHAADVRPGERLVTRVADGEVESTADDPRQPRLFE